MLSRLRQHLAFAQRLAHHGKFVEFQVAQPSMYEFAAARRSSRSQIALFAKHNIQPASGCVGSDSCAVNSSTDYQQVVNRF